MTSENWDSENEPVYSDNGMAFMAMKKAKGLTDKEMAKKMGVSIHTVRSWQGTLASKSTRIMPDYMLMLAQKVIMED